MQLLLAVLAIWLLFTVLGFIVHILWVAALVVAIAWLVGFAFRRGQGSRWYRW